MCRVVRGLRPTCAKNTKLKKLVEIEHKFYLCFLLILLLLVNFVSLESSPQLSQGNTTYNPFHDLIRFHCKISPMFFYFYLVAVPERHPSYGPKLVNFHLKCISK